MCFDIWFLAKSIGVGDISQASVCLPVCLFQYFLKKYNNMFENIAGTFKGYYLIILKLFSHLSCCPVELVWHISFPIFVYRYFFYLNSWKPFNCFKLTFCVHVCVVTLRVTSLKRNFLQNLFLYWQPFWGILGFILRYPLLFLKAVPFCVMKFCSYGFCINMTVSVLRKNSKHVFLCWEYYAAFLGLFWVYSSVSWET